MEIESAIGLNQTPRSFRRQGIQLLASGVPQNMVAAGHQKYKDHLVEPRR